MVEIVNIKINETLFGDQFNEVEINREKLTDLLYSYLKDISLEDFVGLMTNIFQESLEYVDLCNGQKSCQKTSLLFNPQRLDIKGIKYNSIYSSLKDKSFVNGLARAILFKKGKVSELLYQVIQLGVNSAGYANEFPPHIAKMIYEKYGMSLDSKILDSCAGWGGRMIGASCLVNCYDAFEPATKTYNGLIRLGEFLKTYRKDFKFKVIKQPFEDSILRENYYDIALTSPPYYDTENYSNEENNSLNRYNNFNKWCSGFYLPMIEKTMLALKANKYFVLNIGSRVYPLNRILIDSFGKKYKINKLENYLSGKAGLRNSEAEGEMFYSIQKTLP